MSTLTVPPPAPNALAQYDFRLTGKESKLVLQGLAKNVAPGPAAMVCIGQNLRITGQVYERDGRLDAEFALDPSDAVLIAPHGQGVRIALHAPVIGGGFQTVASGTIDV